MIISASRRTDIPAYYSDRFFNRLREGYVLVRNPMNPHQVSKVILSPETVDGIVFWTKNPLPMLERLPELEPYPFYFQFTLNAYGKDAEPGLPSKNDVLIPAFRQLSEAVGRQRVVWRYDPVFLSEKYTMEYHIRYFRSLAARLGDYTEKCTVSFIDLYTKTVRNARPLQIQPETSEQQFALMERFAETAKTYGLQLDTCAEPADFSSLGVGHAHCIDRERLERIGGYRLSAEKDTNQRPACGCAASIDIGAYNTCPNGCLYCYANYSAGAVLRNAAVHDPKSPLLFGELGKDDVVRERAAVSHRDCQISLFGP